MSAPKTAVGKASARAKKPAAAKGGKGRNDDEGLDLESHAEALLQRSHRLDLERFVLANLSHETIVKNLSSVQGDKVVGVFLGKQVKVQEVQLRNGASTGAFDKLPNEPLFHILNYVPPYHRLRAVLKVCRSWYELRNETAIWGQLSIGLDVRSLSLNCASDTLRALPQRINLSQLHHLSLHDLSADSNAIKAFLKKIVSSPLVFLSLHKVIKKSKLLAAMAALSLGKLETLHIEDKVGLAAFSEMLDVCPSLRCLHAEVDDNTEMRAPLDHIVRAVHASLSRARKGGSPAVSDLTLMGTSWHDRGIGAGCFFGDMSRFFPEVRVLSTALLCTQWLEDNEFGSSGVAAEASSSSSSSSSSLASTTIPGLPIFARLTSLTLTITGISRVFCVPGTPESAFSYHDVTQGAELQASAVAHYIARLEAAVRLLAAACPLITTLRLALATVRHLNKKDRNAGLFLSPRLAVPACLAIALSPRLEHLSLHNFVFPLEAFELFSLERWAAAACC